MTDGESWRFHGLDPESFFDGLVQALKSMGDKNHGGFFR